MLGQGVLVLTPFDAYEISKVHAFAGNSEAGPWVERCEGSCNDESECPTAAEARTFWSLYGHIPGEGAECIGDFDTEEGARSVLARILGRDLTGEQSPFPVLKGGL